MSGDSSELYELFYWPKIQGRGEFVRLALEAAGAPYVDVARLPESKGGGVPAMMKIVREGPADLLPFAPPFLRVGGLVVAQTANILLFLGPRLGLVPEGEAERLAANQLELTICDLVGEAHDTHHPIATGLYYEDQKAEAKLRARHFLDARLPKFLGYFERVLTANAGDKGAHLVGDRLSYVDLSAFQVLSGLAYAFPRAMARLGPGFPGLSAPRDRVAAEPSVSAYLASERRIAWNEDGIFRRYPELDDP